MPTVINAHTVTYRPTSGNSFQSVPIELYYELRKSAVYRLETSVGLITISSANRKPYEVTTVQNRKFSGDRGLRLRPR